MPRIGKSGATGVAFEPAALDQIVRETRGYPYFLQEWGKHIWDIAARSPITLQDVTKASRHGVYRADVRPVHEADHARGRLAYGGVKQAEALAIPDPAPDVKAQNSARAKLDR